MQEELRRDQVEELRQWQRRMIAIFVPSVASLVILVVGEIVLDLPALLEFAIVLTLVTLVGLGAWLQLKQKCPKCGYRIGFQSGLLTPLTCKRCGVSLRARNRR